MTVCYLLTLSLSLWKGQVTCLLLQDWGCFDFTGPHQGVQQMTAIEPNGFFPLFSVAVRGAAASLLSCLHI